MFSLFKFRKTFIISHFSLLFSQFNFNSKTERKTEHFSKWHGTTHQCSTTRFSMPTNKCLKWNCLFSSWNAVYLSLGYFNDSLKKHRHTPQQTQHIHTRHTKTHSHSHLHNRVRKSRFAWLFCFTKITSLFGAFYKQGWLWFRW